MRPALKSYVYFAPIEEGVYFRADERIFILTSKAPYRVVAQLLALLDGEQSLEEIQRGLPAPVVPLFDRLVYELSKYKMLVDCSRRSEGQLSDGERKSFQGLLLYLRDHLDDYEGGFASWRQVRFTIIGGGEVAAGLVRSLLNLGVRGIEHRPTHNSDPSALAPALSGHAITDPMFEWSIAPIEADWRFSPSGRVIFADHDLDEGLIRAWSARANPMLVGVLDGRCVIGPGLGDVGAVDLTERLIASPPEAPSVSRSQITLLGASAAFELFMIETGCDSNRLRNTVLTVENDLQIGAHPLLPAASVGATRPWTPGVRRAERGATPEGRPLAPFETISLKIKPMFDPMFGPFTRKNLGNLSQLPLHHDAIEIRYPSSLELPQDLVVAWGFGAENAARRVLASAFQIYAARIHQSVRKASTVLCADLDSETWRRRAVAQALISTQAFSARAVIGEVESIAVPSREGQILARIARLYRPDGLHLHVVTAPGLPVAYAICRDSQGALAYAVSDTAFDAVIECLGGACSALQRGVRHDLPLPIQPRRRVSPKEAEDWLSAPARPALALPFRVKENLFRLEAIGDPLGVTIGNVELVFDIEGAVSA